VRRQLAKGQSEEWVRERIDGIATRNELTNEWHERGIRNRMHYAILTKLLQTLSLGMGPQEHKSYKGLKPTTPLRNHYTELELLLTRLGERATIEIAQTDNAQGYRENRKAVEQGGEIAKNARLQLEALGVLVASKENFLPKPPAAITGPA
jgi:hypothetical protein